MSDLWWGYFGVEAKPVMSAGHVSTLVSGLRSLGSQNHPQPGKRNWGPRVRLDNRAAIFEAEFDKANLTLEWFTARLAALYDVPPATISTTVAFGFWGGETTPVVTFWRQEAQTLVMAAFAGVEASHEESGAAARGYLAANAADWETPDPE